jgi:hypothetical protein
MDELATVFGMINLRLLHRLLAAKHITFPRGLMQMVERRPLFKYQQV